jgi:aminoglycoside phosphotransferase (APT) family kinase protein
MEYLQGRVLTDQPLPGMRAGEVSAIYNELKRVLAAFHSVDVSAVGLADLGKPTTTSPAKSRAGHGR